MMRLVCMAALLGFAPIAHADASKFSSRHAAFALIIGVNQSVDRDLRSLQYADDDAARYFDLFRAMGARSYLLTRPDENTRRLHTQASAEAFEPRAAAFEQVEKLLAADIQKARTRGHATLLYVVYAGHGNVKGGEGYVTLEDARLSGEKLRALFERLRPDQTHLIVDACNSYFLAHSRGPGGERRAVHGFSNLKDMFPDGRVGLLLSTTTARESHEWDAFQAGVFSHEVRSGLYGAADANGDGQVSYREIAAFIDRANAAIPNERFRPKVFARPPTRSPILVDLRGLDRHILEVDGQHAGRYFLEDALGVRLADFHSGFDQRVRLLRPASAGLLYLHRVSDDREYVIQQAPAMVALASLEPSPARIRPRGAAHQAFNLIFSLPFTREVVSRFEQPPSAVVAESRTSPGARAKPRWRRVVGWGGVGLGAAAITTALALTITAHTLAGGNNGLSQYAIADRNDRIDAYNVGAVTLYSIGGAALAVGIAALLWPDSKHSEPAVRVITAGSSLAISGHF